MDIDASRHARRLGGAAAVLALTWAFAPQTTHADIGAYIAGLDTSVCQLSGLTIQAASPLSGALPTSTAGQDTYNISATGTCSGLAAGPFSFTGSGVISGTPTCSGFLSSGGAQMQVGSFFYPTVQFTLTGVTAGSQMTIVNSTSGVDVGAAQLSLTTASLNACMQPGGTTTLQYSGVVTMAF